VRSIGADAVIDYTREDFTRSKQQYDLLFDLVGNRTLADCLGHCLRAGPTSRAAAGAGPKQLGPDGANASNRRFKRGLRAGRCLDFAKINREDLRCLPIWSKKEK